MTFKIHERGNRGTTKTGWLESYHTFSFGHFRDPARMRFKSLRVINEDFVIPGAGFQTHPHDNMEIITYILEGELAHKDSMGNGSVIRKGEIQKMSAGTGVTHSEFNPSNDNPVHLLQIWIMPDTRDIEPSYEQIQTDEARLQKGFTLVGDKHGTGGAVTIHQDARLYIAKPSSGEKLSYEFASGRGGFLHIARGQVQIDDEILKAGDALEMSDVEKFSLTALEDSELLLFDLA